MSGLLTEPTCVLILTDDNSVTDTVTSALGSDWRGDVVTVSTCERAVSEFDARTDVGCIIVTDHLEGRTVTEACEVLRSEDDHCPILAYVTDGSEMLAHRVIRAGANDYVPAASPAGSKSDDAVEPTTDDAAESLLSCVEALIDQYDVTRWQAADSSMLGTILDAFDIALFVKDEDGRHLRKSRTAGDVSPDEIRGKTDVEVYGERERDSYEEDLRVIQSGEAIIDKECSFDAPDGTHWTRTTKVPWRTDDGDIRGLVGKSEDITEEIARRRQLEQHKKQLEDVAQTYAHDLRTPLQIASGYLEVARETESESAFEEVETALRRMDDMLEDLSQLVIDRDLSDSPGDDSILESTILGDVIEEIWSVVRTEGATLEREIPDDALATASKSSLRPVLENLIRNAIVHADSDVTVRIGALSTGGFYVEDDGPGIPPAKRETVFEQGYSTAETGSGLGLGIVTNVAEKEGWRIEITEGPEGGARIEVHNCPVIVDARVPSETDDRRSLSDATDVGPVERVGTATAGDEPGQWIVEGAGQNIFAQTNEFHYVYASVEGPIRLEGRVVDIEDVGAWNTAGLMVRDDLEADAAYGHIGVSRNHGTGLLWRAKRGIDGINYHVPQLTFPQWFRIDYVDGWVTVSVSSNGSDWTPLDQRCIDVRNPLYVGLAVCSNLSGKRCRALFEDVSLTRLEPLES